MERGLDSAAYEFVDMAYAALYGWGMTDLTHGAILRKFREEAELSMAALGERAGVPKPSIQVYEGGTLPNVGAALRLARALGTTVETIWGGLVLPDDTACEPACERACEPADGAA